MHLGDLRIPDHPNVGMFQHAIGHHLRRAEAVAAVNDDHLAGELREVHRLFHRGIATANHREGLVAVEGHRPVADGAGGDAATGGGQPQFVVEPDPPCGGTRGHQHGVRGDWR